MARIRNKTTGLVATCDDKLADRFLEKGWVLASDYVAPDPSAAPGNLQVKGESKLEVGELAEALASIVLARLAAAPAPGAIEEAAAIDSPDGTNANPPEGEPAGDTDDDKPVKRGQTRRTTK